jgi:flagellar biosynthetic protein FliS
MRGIAAYKSVSLESSDQRKLVVMCFEALIRRQRAAMRSFEEKKFLEGVEHVRIAREIFSELLIGLDPDAAPDMATNLASLYQYCLRELTLAGHESTSEHILTSLKVTEELYMGFKSAFSSD